MAMGLPEFDVLRRRLQSQYAQRRGEAGDALQRRFASQGMLSSGAYQKQAEMQERELGREEADALGQLGLAETQETQRRKEIQEGRDFARSEREATQGFARGERESTQGFARGEREAAQLFQRGIFDIEHGLRERQFIEQQNQFNKQFNEGLRQFDAQLTESKRQFDTGLDFQKSESAKNVAINKISALLGALGDDFDDDRKRNRAQNYLESLYRQFGIEV